MSEAMLNIPKNVVFDLLKSQPEQVLIELFENLMVSYDSSPLNNEEKDEIESALKEYEGGKTQRIYI